LATSLRPSEASKTATGTAAADSPRRSAVAIHPSKSERGTRMRPHDIFSQTARALSSMVQCTASHGRPSPLFNVATRPFVSRLRPPGAGTQHPPSGKKQKVVTPPPVYHAGDKHSRPRPTWKDPPPAVG